MLKIKSSQTSPGRIHSFTLSTRPIFGDYGSVMSSQTSEKPVDDDNNFETNKEADLVLEAAPTVNPWDPSQFPDGGLKA